MSVGTPIKGWIDNATPVNVNWITGLGGMKGAVIIHTAEVGITFEAYGGTWFAPWSSILNIHTGIVEP